MNKCDYIPSNTILLDKKYKEVIQNDLFNSHGKYLFDFSHTNILDKPILTKVDIALDNGRLRISGEVNIPFSELTFNVDGAVSNIELDGNSFSYLLNQNTSLDSEIAINIVSPSLVYGEEYILEYDFIEPILSMVGVSTDGNNIWVRGNSTDLESPITIIVNDSYFLTTTPSTEDGNFRLILPLSEYRGRIEVYSVDGSDNKSNVIILSLESIKTFTSIILNRNPYIDGLDLLHDKAGIK